MTSLGANLGFVDEMYARFRDDPASVSDAWREFFADYEPPPGQEVRLAAQRLETEPPVSPDADTEERPALEPKSRAMRSSTLRCTV